MRGLNPDNPVGADKALVFEQRLGYTKDKHEGLLRQISDRALDAEAVTKEANRHGQRYQVDLEITEVDGQAAGLCG